MTGQIFTDGNFQGVGNDGLVASLGALTVVVSSTGLNATTWQDSAMTITNTNPINLSSSGKAKVFLNAGTYNITLKDINGIVIWTLNDYIVDDYYTKAEVDATKADKNATPYTVATVADLATINTTTFKTAIVKDDLGRGHFNHKTAVEINPHTGVLYAVDGGTVYAALGGGFWAMDYAISISIKWFGANTSNTDVVNTTAIQNAHNLSAISGFPNVEFDAGIYLFTSLNWSPLVKAVAKAKTVLRTTNLTGIAIHISTEFGNWGTVPQQLKYSSTGEVFSGNFVLEPTVDGQPSTGIFFGQDSLTLGYSAEHIKISDMKIRGFGTSHTFGTSAYCVTFDSCKFSENGNHIFLSTSYVDNAERITYNCCTFNGGTNVINGDVDYYGDYYFIDCSFDYNTRFFANVQGNAIINISVSHFEFDPALQLMVVNKNRVSISDSYYLATLVTTIADPLLAVVTNGGYLVVSNNTYNTPTGANLYAVADATSTFIGEDDYKQFGGAENLYINNYGGGNVRVAEDNLVVIGYNKDRSGFIQQWGTIPTTNIGVNANASVTVTYSKPFPANCSFATATMQPSGSADCYGMIYRENGATPTLSTTFVFRNGASAQDFINGAWYACGY